MQTNSQSHGHQQLKHVMPFFHYELCPSQFCSYNMCTYALSFYVIAMGKGHITLVYVHKIAWSGQLIISYLS